MKPEKLTVHELFEPNIRYVIPTFQRPYVWTKKDQWAPLLEDVCNLAENYLEATKKREESRAAAQYSVGKHFLGAVVIQLVTTPIGELKRSNVIDGQQRITTLQLLLDAAQEVLELEGHAREAMLLARLVLNHEDYAQGDDRFKLWPTLNDRDAFRAAMTNGAPVDVHNESQIVEAHSYFSEQIRHWLSQSREHAPAERAHALFAALAGLLEMVVIYLESDEDAYLIFETLNARGTPLLASDLVKNYLLQRATGAGADSDRLHDRLWRTFEQRWWRKETRQGRIVWPRIDVFLNYWLIARTRAEIASQKLFPEFKKYVEARDRSVEDLMQDLHDMGKTYRRVQKLEKYTPEETFIYRWDVMQAGVFTPVLLLLFGAGEARLPRERLLRALQIIESYLVRRMVCRLTTKDYNHLVRDLLGAIEDNLATADEAVSGLLASQTAESRQWPDDATVGRALLDLPLYRMLTRGRLRLVLEGIEQTLRTSKAEEQHCPRKLTIEHILPQRWAAHWPLPEEDPERRDELAAQRNHLLHTLGNLSLINNKLNPSLSNAAWEKKREGLQEHSTIFLNKRLLADFSVRFAEEEILQRGEALGEIFFRCWPRPRIQAEET